MNDEHENLMRAYGITSITKRLYLYKEFRYERVEDAIRYAQAEARRNGDPRADTAAFLEEKS